MKNLSLLFVLFLSLAAKGQIINTIAGTGTWSCGGDGAPATALAVGQLLGVAVDTSGNVYFSSITCARVKKISTSGVISTIAGNGTNMSSGDGGPATAAGLDWPSGIALDKQGNLYICELYSNVIRKVTPAGIISTIAGSPSLPGGGYSGDGGPATAALLGGPEDIAIDSIGNIYIAESGNNVIRMISNTGIINRVAGSGVYASSGDGGAALTAGIQNPASVSVDKYGNIYIVEDINHKVRKVSAATGIITTIAGNGTAGYSGNGGPATAAQFYYPTCVRADAHGNVFITDSHNGLVRKVDAAGIISNFAGGGFGGDGIMATQSSLDIPSFLTIGKDDYLYICEQDGARVRKIDTCLVPLSSPVTGMATICAGASVVLSSALPGGVWSSSDGSVAVINSSGIVTGLGAGITTISYSVTNACATVHNTATIVVGPYAGTISGPYFICPGHPEVLSSNVPGGTWWSSNTSVATVSASGVATTAGVWDSCTIFYTTSDFCGTATSSFLLNKCPPVATPELHVMDELVIFPNPVHDQLTINAQGTINDVEIYSVLGNKVLSRKCNQASLELDVAFLPPGIYIMRIDGGVVRRFVKQ